MLENIGLYSVYCSQEKLLIFNWNESISEILKHTDFDYVVNTSERFSGQGT